MPLAAALRRVALAATLAACVGGAADAQSNAPGTRPAPGAAPGAAPTPAPAPTPFPSGTASPLIGRWSESTTCVRTSTQFVFTRNSFEIIGRDGRWYVANVAHVRQGADPAVQVTAAPGLTRLGPAGPGLGDTYVFRNDPVNRITPLEIVRANGRRDRVGNDTPVFTRCR